MVWFYVFFIVLSPSLVCSVHILYLTLWYPYQNRQTRKCECPYFFVHVSLHYIWFLSSSCLLACCSWRLSANLMSRNTFAVSLWIRLLSLQTSWQKEVCRCTVVVNSESWTREAPTRKLLESVQDEENYVSDCVSKSALLWNEPREEILQEAFSNFILPSMEATWQLEQRTRSWWNMEDISGVRSLLLLIRKRKLTMTVRMMSQIYESWSAAGDLKTQPLLSFIMLDSSRGSGRCDVCWFYQCPVSGCCW